MVALGVVILGLVIGAVAVSLGTNNDDASSSSASAEAIQLRQVVSGDELDGKTCPPASSSPEKATLCTKDGRASVELGPVIVDGTDVLSAEAIQPSESADEWSVLIALNEQGTSDLATATGIAANSPPPANFIGIVVDDVIVSVPQVNEAISGGQIEVGGLTKAEAEDLAAQFG
jgi:preprotein translocase subunit SecD